MSKSNNTDDSKDNSKDNNADFSSLFSDVKPLQQDKIIPPRPHKMRRFDKIDYADNTHNAKSIARRKAEFIFSDGYQAHFPDGQVLIWHKPDENESKANSAEIKRLRRGDYPPDIECDCHGLTQAQAKELITELLHEAKLRQHLCVSIMHGHGKGVLKQQIPNWLVQHPDILGFCQAPKQYGGAAAVLILMDLPEENRKR